MLKWIMLALLLAGAHSQSLRGSPLSEEEAGEVSLPMENTMNSTVVHHMLETLQALIHEQNQSSMNTQTIAQKIMVALNEAPWTENMTEQMWIMLALLLAGAHSQPLRGSPLSEE